MPSPSSRRPRGHGAPDRGLLEAALATTPSRIDRREFRGRFGRIFDKLPAANFSLDSLISLASAMGADQEEEPTLETEVDSEENSGLPAGYTYFGQFVDHDLTLDTATLSMAEEDLEAVENFRTPALDLDSLYGRGPDDQPYLYQSDGRQLDLADRELREGKGGRALTRDLPRSRGRALVGDKRNDENIIVSQLHGLFIQLHNRLAADLPSLDFERVRQLVQWHYQWLVLFDYLPRIVGREVVDRLLPKVGAPPNLRWFKFEHGSIPVEFAGAAYRFGHSMVRPIYRLNLAENIGGTERDPGRLPVFRPPTQGEGLNGFRVIPEELGIDWNLFFETPSGKPAGTQGPDRVQPAYKIDPSLTFPLSQLPEFSERDGQPKDGQVNILALRNLQRGFMLRLPSGQAVARAMGLEPISDEDLIVEKADAEHFTDAKDTPLRRVADGRPEMEGKAPLWCYVLVEARHAWRQEAQAVVDSLPEGTTDAERAAAINRVPTRLGPVGGTLVAETLIGLVAADPRSLLNAGASVGFAPGFGTATTNRYERFSLGDLAAALAVR